MQRSLFVAVAPLLFVLIWSTGWIVAKFASFDAEPLTFLIVRFLGALVLLVPIALISGGGWPRGRAAIGHALMSGVLLHGVYLGGVWWAIAHGVPAGLSAVIAALQPLMTAALAPLMSHERIGAKRMAGFALGFLGIVVVVSPKLAGLSGAALSATLIPLAVNVLAMAAVTVGTFWQKRFVPSGGLMPVAVLQYVGALLVTVPAALAIEDLRFAVTTSSLLTLAWSVIGLSIGAIALLLHLIRCGEVSRAAALIYLVPPTSALEAWFFFGETLTMVQVAGMIVTACGVALANRR
ncbi:DMT family transporter [Pinisolibacter sp.]|uniref:DMT family transporter n=1 Tax=Pinisolibacter sp. TaxID=2172024 RepID=UPI002FDEDE4C